MRAQKNIPDELIFKVLNNEASASENEIFHKWLSHSPQNKKIFLQLEEVWNGSDRIKDYGQINQKHAWNTICVKIKQHSKLRLLRPAIKVAAAIAIAYLLGGLTLYFIQSKPDQNMTSHKEVSVKVPLGSKTGIRLSDGTEVWLNSGSEIRYPAIFDHSRREIYLKGEAYFEVEKNKGIPFFVYTDEIEIKVLGTRFNVKSYPDDDLTEATLVEGSIMISKKGSEEALQLKPNEKASLEKDAAGQPDGSFVITKNIDPELYTSWKNEKLIFKREKFGALAVKLERWYNVQISVENKGLSEEKFTGAFENESLEQVLEAMKISVPFSYEINKNKITIR